MRSLICMCHCILQTAAVMRWRKESDNFDKISCKNVKSFHVVLQRKVAVCLMLISHHHQASHFRSELSI